MIGLILQVHTRPAKRLMLFAILIMTLGAVCHQVRFRRLMRIFWTPRFRLGNMFFRPVTTAGPRLVCFRVFLGELILLANSSVLIFGIGLQSYSVIQHRYDSITIPSVVLGGASVIPTRYTSRE